MQGALACDFITQSIAAACDEDDFAIQVGDGVGVKVAGIQVVNDPLHRWQVTKPEQADMVLAADDVVVRE